MTKPRTSVRSIRLTDEAWAWLSAEAERIGSSVNGLVSGLVDGARRVSPTRLNDQAHPGFNDAVGVSAEARRQAKAPIRVHVPLASNAPVPPGSRLKKR